MLLYFGLEMSKPLSFFQPFSGIDATYQFYSKGRKSVYDVWKVCEDITRKLAATTTTESPFQEWWKTLSDLLLFLVLGNYAHSPEAQSPGTPVSLMATLNYNHMMLIVLATFIL